MNEQRRKLIRKALDELASVRADLEAIRDDEQDAYDGMPESFQNGEKGEAAQEAISNLDDAINNIESAESEAENAIGN